MTQTPQNLPMDSKPETPSDLALEALLRQRLMAVHDRIRNACREGGREEGSVELLAVSKKFPSSAIVACANLGQTAFGENYVQEGLEKIQLIAQSPTSPRGPLAWHLIGPLQSNKAKKVAEKFDWVHTIDRVNIAEKLSTARPEALPPLHVCIQVNIDDEDSKHGCKPSEVMGLARQVSGLPRLKLRGLMAIPSPSATPDVYAALYALYQTLYREIPGIDTLSVGMSADLEMAIAHGATMVRIGTALFGAR